MHNKQKSWKPKAIRENNIHFCHLMHMCVCSSEPGFVHTSMWSTEEDGCYPQEGHPFPLIQYLLLA